jgi:hypothetical protein
MRLSRIAYESRALVVSGEVIDVGVRHEFFGLRSWRAPAPGIAAATGAGGPLPGFAAAGKAGRPRLPSVAGSFP